MLLQERKVLVRNFIKAKYQCCLFVDNKAQCGFVLSSTIFTFAFQRFVKGNAFLHHSFANRSAKSKRVILEDGRYLKCLSLIITFAQSRNASFPCFIASTKKTFNARISSLFVRSSVFSCQKAIAEKQRLNWIREVLAGKTCNISIQLKSWSRLQQDQNQ